jgi:hypothetical protein
MGLNAPAATVFAERTLALGSVNRVSPEQASSPAGAGCDQETDTETRQISAIAARFNMTASFVDTTPYV